MVEAAGGREPSSDASVVALTFMGVRLANWSEVRCCAMAALFSWVVYKKTTDWEDGNRLCRPDVS